MAAGDGEKKVMGWLWLPVGSDPFAHPADPPKDEATASKRWSQDIRGPRLARITPVNILVKKESVKPNHVWIIFQESLREVPKQMVLHEREGFLLIQELIRRTGDSSFLQADWVNKEHRELLEKNSPVGKFLPAAQYVTKLLLRKAVTGARFIDDQGRESSYRRDVLDKELELIPAGVEKDGFFCIKELADYMPPWEAFCYSKCGFYQDFYKVRWAEPYSKTDYSHAENGCTDEPGCTWEPDENLPTCLDGLRTKMKKVWAAAQSEREAKAKRAAPPPQAPDAKRPATASQVKKQEDPPTEEKEEKKVVMRQRRRDKQPLDRDLIRFILGHDFKAKDPDTFGSIRKGWPMHPRDYPPGYAVAAPPGFCWDGCDCMDDQRAQRSWEVNKSWLPQNRGNQAQFALDAFAKEATFVRPRGAVSKQHYFETAQAQTAESAAQRTAADLSVTIQGSLRDACSIIPLSSLTSASDPFYLPARAILSVRENGDYLPLKIVAKQESGQPLPAWLDLNPESGLFRATSDRHKQDVKIIVDLHFYEGSRKTFPLVVTSATPPEKSKFVLPIKQQLREGMNMRQLDGFLRAFLDRELALAERGSLGQLVGCLTKCQNLLRASAVGNLTISHPSRR